MTYLKFVTPWHSCHWWFGKMVSKMYRGKMWDFCEVWIKYWRGRTNSYYSSLGYKTEEVTGSVRGQYGREYGRGQYGREGNIGENGEIYGLGTKNQ